MKAAWLWWSSGKDSAWALHTLKREETYGVTRLITTVNRSPTEDEGGTRVAMHSVRDALLETQSRAAGLPLQRVELSVPASNEAYEAAIAPVLAEAEASKVSAMAFGDLFLEDIRHYRTQLFANTRVEPIFPLWSRDTHALAREMVAAGLCAEVVCVDLGVLDTSFVGVPFDDRFLDRLPAGVDPCGENGEFHTFVTAGPMFRAPLSIRRGAITKRDGFAFADPLPSG